MTDGQWLFTLFALLYFVECLRLYPGSVWLFSSSGKSGWMRRPLQHLDFAGRKFLLLPVLPPVPVHVSLMPWVLVPCSTGLELLDEAGRSAGLIAWAELNPSLDSATLRLSADHAVRFPDEATAGAWIKRLQGWQAASELAREKDFLKLAAQMLDVKRFTLAMTDLSARTHWLRWMSLLIFLMCFGVITLIYRWLGEGPQILAAVGFMLLLLWIQALLFWRAAGRLKEPIKHPFWKTLAIAFLPQHAMRAADHVCSALPCLAHPLVALTSVPESSRLALVRLFWKAIHHGQSQSAHLQERALESFFKDQNISKDQLETAPDKQPGSVAYCPRCEAQFSDAKAHCQDCGGLTLKAF